MRRRADRRKYHYIYRITCSITGRYYIGMHSTDDLEDGYMGSGKRLRYSINKHGIDNHSKEIIEFTDDRSSLKKREADLVNEDVIKDDLCMNLKLGGEGGWDHIKTNKNPTPGWKAGLKGYWLGRKLTNEHRANISKGQMGRSPTFKGKKHTEATKFLMSNSQKDKQCGHLNSQFGSKWMIKNGQSKKVKSIDIDSYIGDGWSFGR